MKKTLLLLAALFILLPSASAAGYTQNRYPLAEVPYLELPIGAIRADGWLLEQLNRQKDGLTGHLDEVYPQVVGDRNAWLGGDGDCWERGPYWIDGLLPLAYILNDEGLKAKAGKWVEAILNSQDSAGFFGPSVDLPAEPGLQRNNSHDWWPKMVALKILKQYYMATADERVIPFLTNYFKYELEMLPKYHLDHWTYWGRQRAGDNLEVVYWLYNITGDEFLLKLGNLIHSQTYDWTNLFTASETLYRQNSIHCVNLGQGFKEPVVYYQQSKDSKYLNAPKEGMKKIRNFIGLPTGLWAGDEMIHIGDPNRGSELCTAVEMMFSLEEMLRISGDLQWADQLERVAYNALPTQTDEHFGTRQYYQQTNQISVTNEQRVFSTLYLGKDQLFGELTGYPCCTCNMHQGWPKFTQNLWYATPDNGVAALVYAPSEVTMKVADGVDIVIKEDTWYPFEGVVNFTMDFPEKKVKGAFFPFRFRVPQWSVGAYVSINGEKQANVLHAGETVCISRKWSKGDVITLTLPMKVSVSRWYDNAATVERGPLLYALRMKENWKKVDVAPAEQVAAGKWYYEITSDSKWNYALLSGNFSAKNIDKAFEVVKSDKRAAYPWTEANAPIVIKTTAVTLPYWKEYNGSAGPVIFSHSKKDYGEQCEIELIPYGCTKLRIAEFPVRK